MPAICVFFLVCAVPLSAGGRKDKPLERIDTLINEKQYDQAIHALVVYMRENPDNFELAQERIRRIGGIRGQYNLLTNELLNIISQDPDNVDQILAITRQIEALESSQSFQAREFIVRTQALAQFTINRRRLEEILNRGRELTEAGNFREALRVYQEGLDIYQAEFFSSGYGDEVELPVRESLNGLVNGIGDFEAAAGALGGLMPELAAALGGGADTSGDVALFSQVARELDTLVRFRETAGGAGRYFSGQLRALQALDPAIGDRSFLSFAARLIYGHSGDGEEDGMIHAMEAYWAGTMGALKGTVTAAALASYRQALARAKAKQYAAAGPNFEEALAYNAMARDVLETNRAFWEPAGKPVVWIAGTPALPADAFDVILCNSRDFAITRSQQAEGLELALEAIFTTAPGTGGSGEGLRGAFDGFLAQADALIAEARGAEAEFNRDFEQFALSSGERAPGDGPAAGPAGGEGEEISRYTGDVVELAGDFRSRCIGMELALAVQRYTLLNEELEARLEGRQAEFSAGSRLLEGLTRGEAAEIFSRAGVASPAVPGEGTVETGEARYYYPREALAELSRMGDSIGGDIEYGRELLARYGGERPELFAAGGLDFLRSSALAVARELESLRNHGEESARLAAGRAAMADNFRARGDRYYQEARDAVDRNDFGSARDRIQRSAEQYNESLAVQESVALRQEWDTRMLALGQEISQRENEIVIRDVREMVNQARREYFAGNFEDAEGLLVRGQNRWNVTNVEENPEISYWLSMVRGALSLRSSRVIPVTAPLFMEMGQLLNDAYRNYEEGAALIGANRRSEGMARFNAARQKTQGVKLIFPVNHEAGMLELRMDQVADPEAFNASFQRRLNEAVAGTKRQSAESFADLQNLAELNPGFPGIRGVLWQAEIDMGYRTVPPDPQTLRRSDELTRAARAIVESNAWQQFEAALRQINEALSLNPNNDQAMTLKDRIQARMGTGNAVLSSAAEGEYQRAVRELQQGNTLMAMSIVEQLLQNPQHQSSTRILDLRRRIEAIL